MGFLDKYLVRSKHRSEGQIKVIKVMLITSFFGLMGLYLLAKPLGPMREIGMWAALVQMVFFTCFGYLVCFERYIQSSSSEGSEIE